MAPHPATTLGATTPSSAKYVANLARVPKITGTASMTIAAQYSMDTKWCVDSGAADHLTTDLEKLTVHEKYHGAGTNPWR